MKLHQANYTHLRPNNGIQLKTRQNSECKKKTVHDMTLCESMGVECYIEEKRKSNYSKPSFFAQNKKNPTLIGIFCIFS